MTDRPELDDAALDALFDAARTEAPQPSDALIARILADAEPSEPAPAQAPSRPWTAVLSALGGWRAGAGLALAGVAGLVIGFVSPEALDAVAPGYSISASGYGLEDLMPGFDAALDEG